MAWIVGTSGDDTGLFGTGSDDFIFGLAGNDVLFGEGGHDSLDGGTGADAMAGGTGNDVYMVDNVGDVVFEFGGQGTDEVRSSITHTLAAAVENLVLLGSAAIDGFGNSLNNEIDGNSGANYLSGEGGNDTLDGKGGNDILIGGAGADAMIGGTGVDAMAGGTGNDTYYVDNAGDVTFEWGGEGTDTVYSSINWELDGAIENLTLTGSAALKGFGNGLNNQITGNSGNNLLDGGEGSDTINGGVGADTMYGGNGSDTYYVDNVGDVVLEFGTEFDIDVVRTTITLINPTNIDRMYLIGSAAINGYGNDADNWIVGNSNSNTLTGGLGHDKLDGGVGADIMIGGIGGDIYTVDNVGDIVIELNEDGEDSVGSLLLDYTLGANVEQLFLYGSAVSGTGNELDNEIYGHWTNETLIGLDGNDTLDGQSGVDTMIGGIGNDLYRVMDVGDVIIENAGEGHDTVHIWADYTMDAHVEDLYMQGFFLELSATGNILDNHMEGDNSVNTLHGGAGNDEIYGWWNNDTLSGGLDHDQLFGGDGLDLLIGGEGHDTMFGGAGADTFRITSLADALPLGYMFTDYLPDFSSTEGDKIDLAAIDADTTLAGDQEFDPIGVEVAFNGIAGELRFNGGFLEGDVNGDAVADFQIELDVLSLNASDIIL